MYIYIYICSSCKQKMLLIHLCHSILSFLDGLEGSSGPFPDRSPGPGRRAAGFDPGMENHGKTMGNHGKTMESTTDPQGVVS